MADSFFGFDSSLPALGGKLEVDNELIEAPEADDIDLLNDETFGDGAEDGNWEAEHEKLAEVLESSFQAKARGMDSTTDSGFNTGDRSYRSQEEELEQSINQLMVDDDDIDDSLETSVSRGKPIPGRKSLDEIFGPSSPPGFLNTENLVSPGRQNIWGSPARDSGLKAHEDGLKSLLKALQTPKAGPPVQDPSIVTAGKSLSTSLPSPAIRTVQDIEEELMGQNRARALTVEELERQMQSGAKAVPHRYRSPSPPQASLPLPIGTPPTGVFLQQMPQVHSGMPTSVHSGMPTPVHSGMPTSVRAGLPTSIHSGMPTASPAANGHISALTTMMGRVSPTEAVSGLHRTVSPPARARMSSPTLFTARKTPSPPMTHTVAPPSIAACMSPAIQGRMVTSVKTGQVLTPIGRGILHGMIGGHISPPQATVLHSSPVVSASRPREGATSPTMAQFLANTAVQQRLSFPLPYRDPSHIRGRGPPAPQVRQAMINNQNFRMRGSQRHPFDPREHQHNRDGSFYRDHPHNREGARHRNMSFNRDQPFHRDRDQHQQRDQQEFYNRGRRRPPGYGQHVPWEERGHHDQGPVDEYANLMTQREKDWIIKIQLIQLQTENPYIDDYYYTTFTMKKMMQEHQQKTNGEGGDDSEPKLLLPQLARVEMRNYKPAQFEGSLGRLTASSVHNPRQIIDIRVKPDHTEEEAKHKEVKKFKLLLMEIEKAYDLLLDIDDIEKKVLALPEEARQPLYVQREAQLASLVNRFHCQAHETEALLSLLGVKKGKKLVARTLPILHKPQAEEVVCAILRNLVAIMRRDVEENLSQLYRPVAMTIKRSNLETLVNFSRELTNGSGANNQTTAVASALQNKFGASIIWCLVSRGEVVYSTESPVDLDTQHQTQWSQFIQWLADAANMISESYLARSVENFANLHAHFERFVDKKTLVGVEDRLSSAFRSVEEVS